MRIMKTLFSAMLMFLAVVAVFSQEKDNQFQSNTQKNEMEKLAPLAGKWMGEGWIQQGVAHSEFAGTETVQRKIDGLALLVEGRFTDKKDSSKVIHETLAVLNYNAKTSAYDFKTYLASGSSGSFNFKPISAAVYEWGLDFPGNKILYTITIKDGVWNEVGKISRDEGKNWMQFFEMNLRKQS